MARCGRTYGLAGPARRSAGRSGRLFGILAGFLIGISSLARAVGIPVISAMFPMPKIALLPLFILWLGIGETSKIAVIGLGVFFPTTIATFSAIDAVPRGLIRMAQSFDLPWFEILRKVVLPGGVAGHSLVGFRITASVALLLLVSAEMIGAQYGIGAFVLTAGQLMQIDALLAGRLRDLGAGIADRDGAEPTGKAPAALALT